MMTKRMNLNLEDLDQVTGGVTYEYDNFLVVIPDGEEDPYTPTNRLVTGAIVNLARKNGKTLQDLLDDPLVADETKERIKYYWDKVITK